MSVNRCSRCVSAHDFKGHVECGNPYVAIEDGNFIEVYPLDAKNMYDSDMFRIENLANCGIELRELALESNDVLGASNLVNGAVDVVNFIGIQKINKNVVEKSIGENPNHQSQQTQGTNSETNKNE